MYGGSLIKLLLVLLLMAIPIACSPAHYVDDDDRCSKARPLPFGNIIHDQVDVKRGDKVDCKQLKYFTDARAKLTYTIGTAFEQHDIRGKLTLYDANAKVLDRKVVDPAVPKYEFNFSVEARKVYYIKFEAATGAHGYTGEVVYTRDPCARCTDAERCVDGQCRDKNYCDPPCNLDSEICEAGACVSACGRRCRRGYTCNADSGNCERAGLTCKPRCGVGQYCSRRNGKCYTKKGVCSPSCTGNTTCRSGKCVAKGTQCPPCPSAHKCDQSTGFKCVSTTPSLGPIRGTVTTTSRAGLNTTIYINRGKRNGVAKGMKGKMCGKHRFTIVRALPFRSKAIVQSSVEEIGQCSSVIIYR